MRRLCLNGTAAEFLEIFGEIRDTRDENPLHFQGTEARLSM
jgi:hypothetical protein